jgi:hypothetical protein
MTVLAKSKSGAGVIRRHREGRFGRTSGRAETVRTENPASPDPVQKAQSSASGRRRREAGAPQDQAVYACHCGFVFEAQVSTSVDCPHCDSTQAW